MDLKGAKIRNIYRLCQKIESDNDITLNVNIPYYQRPYKWQKEQINNLFNDFIDNKNSNTEKDEYFVGSVVTVQKHDDDYFDVVDGQQRITTVFLLNYMKFLLLRAYVEELLVTRKMFAISSALEKLKNCCIKLLCDKNKQQLEIMIKEIETYLEQMTSDNQDEMYTKALKAFQNGLALPEKIHDENYNVKYQQKFQTFFSAADLSLKYSRKRYNDSLKFVLTNVGIKLTSAMLPAFFHTCDVNDVDENVMQYVNAINYIFDNLYEKTEADLPLEKCAKMIELAEAMLENIKFCVIITGNEKDAYTLFEVLNDRALEVDDLDLIKNLFYKKYCTTTNDKDDVIDGHITILDEIWNESFSGAGVEKSKLIAYLGTVYLTGDCNLDLKHKQRYREVIEDHYFDEVFASEEYGFVNVENDFKVFQMIRIMTKKFDLAFQKQYAAALKAENKTGKSVTYKTTHLLLALIPSVLPAISNTILRTFIDKFANGGKTAINISKFESYVDELLDGNSENNSEYQLINDLAYTLWTTTLLAKNFEIPRALATKVIKNVNVKSSQMPTALVSAPEQTKLENEFTEWTNGWQYGNATGDLKIKILFMNLLKFSKDGSSLKYKEISSFLNHPENIQLDHLEANIKESVFEKYYFNPVDINADRKQYVNSLGNFMILDSDNNNHKNNHPLWKALDFYTNMGDHWVIAELKDMMSKDEYSVQVDANMRVPKEEFFNKRKSQLQKYFLAILKRSKEQKTINLT